MKRRREERMEILTAESTTEIRCAIQQLSSILLHLPLKPSPPPLPLPLPLPPPAPATAVAPNIIDSHIPTLPFLSICHFLLHVLDKIGPTMAVLRQDIQQNIQRLEKMHDSDPCLYSNVVEILKKEISEGNERKGPTCTKALVWLTRSLDFTLALLKLLVEDLERNMEQAVQESYTNTLKPWHGWISSAAYKVALKLVPDSKSLITILMGKKENKDDFKKQVRTFISLMTPLLEEIHTVLVTYEVDNLKST